MLQNVISIWTGLSARRRIIVVGATVAMFLAVLALARMAGGPQMVLLYAGLDGRAAGEVCDAGKCSITFVAKGTALTAQTTGDCKTAQCDGAGGIEYVAAASDLPNDGKECTDDVCTGTVASNPPKSSAPFSALK